MRIGQPATISATTVPEGVALTWRSDNTDAVTVDQDGNVTGLEWWTEAKVYASFEYDGETYSDYVKVCVREYDLEESLTNNDTWADDSAYIDKVYFSDTRKTYIVHAPNAGMFGDGAIRHVYNPDGSETSIYARLIMAPTLEYDENKDYFLEVYYKTSSDADCEIEYLNGVFARDGWANRYQVPAGDEDVVYLPLKEGTILTRNCGLQTRSSMTSATATCILGLAIVSRPKA